MTVNESLSHEKKKNNTIYINIYMISLHGVMYICITY